MSNCCYDECKQGKFIVGKVFNPGEGEGRPPQEIPVYAEICMIRKFVCKYVIL